MVSAQLVTSSMACKCLFVRSAISRKMRIFLCRSGSLCSLLIRALSILMIFKNPIPINSVSKKVSAEIIWPSMIHIYIGLYKNSIVRITDFDFRNT